MSRIGQQPITIPSGVEVSIDGAKVAVKGPKGQLDLDIVGGVSITRDGDTLLVERVDDSRDNRSLHGLQRSLIANMFTGVSDGFSKDLEIVGVGYRAQKTGDKLVLALGYSHPVEIDPPAGISFELENPTRLAVVGIDKELVGQMAAKIRATRKPEPYKGKGVRYAGEKVRRKAGKAGKIGGKK
jgi:large subunit ribosomal protein L6